MRVVSYLKAARKTRHGLWIVAARAVVFLVMLVLFVRYVPWVTSHDMTELVVYSEPQPRPPRWAQAFSVNHGENSPTTVSHRPTTRPSWLRLWCRFY